MAAERPGPVRTDTGLTVLVEHGIERVAQADLVIALGWEEVEREPPEALCRALRETVARGARVMSHCSGAVVLAAAGLLEGRRVTTHWRYAAELARRYPGVTIDADVLYVDDDPIFSSAGTAAGIDTCLYLLRREHGAAVANAIARRMVVPPHREGGQAQYVEVPVPAPDDGSRLREVLAWAQAHLDEPLTVDQLAARALMSARSFARHFRADTGATPHVYGAGIGGPRPQHADRMAAGAAGRPRPAAARGDRPRRRGGRPAQRLRRPYDAAPPLRAARRHLPSGLPPDLPGRAGDRRHGRRLSGGVPAPDF